MYTLEHVINRKITGIKFHGINFTMAHFFRSIKRIRI